MRNTKVANELAGIGVTLDGIQGALEKLAAPPPETRVEQHFHGELTDQGRAHLERSLKSVDLHRGSIGPVADRPWRDIGHVSGDPDSRVFVAELVPEVTNELARVAVLSVALNLKNRLDAKRVFEGSDVLETMDRYAEVQKLRELLGAVTDEELEKATALYDTLAS